MALLTEFFANMLLQLFSGRLSGGQSYAHALPSFWFLGIYQTLAHVTRPGMDLLGQRALFATGAAVAISIAAYTLCYRKRFLRLAESLDVIGGARHAHRIHFPDWLVTSIFPTRFECACANFIGAVLLRSERHLMFIGAYLGIGLVLTAQTAMDSFNRHAASLVPDSDLLAIPLMIAFFIATGLRFAFDMPATLNANWLFRAILEHPSPNPRRPVRKIMLLSVLTWQIAVLLPLTWMRSGWQIAAMHTLWVAVLSTTLIELLLARFQKIPFTCSTRPDIPRLLMRILGAVFGVLIVVPILASMEQSMLLNPLRFIYGGILVAGGWYWILRYRSDASIAEQCITFEDAPPPQFELLKLV
ncbi:MAG: hypothetical protein JO051_03745 [Acidobacteriaceae bacterium]|nr:hypothetical protein [Acidobacteriaceae bacterium]